KICDVGEGIIPGRIKFQRKNGSEASEDVEVIPLDHGADRRSEDNPPDAVFRNSACYDICPAGHTSSCQRDLVPGWYRKQIYAGTFLVTLVLPFATPSGDLARRRRARISARKAGIAPFIYGPRQVVKNGLCAAGRGAARGLAAFVLKLRLDSRAGN